MTRALLLLSLAVPAGAWEFGNGAGVEERSAELRGYWRPFNKTMVDLDMVKRSAQDEEPDWVTREKEKMTLPERPFGRLAGFVMRRDDVRFYVVGRHGPLTEGLKDGAARKERLAALKRAEAAAVETLLETLSKEGEEGLELTSSAPGRASFSSEGAGEPVRVVWHPLDFYRDQGRGADLYVLLYADRRRAGVPPAAPAAAAPAEDKAVFPSRRKPPVGFGSPR